MYFSTYDDYSYFIMKTAFVGSLLLLPNLSTVIINLLKKKLVTDDKSVRLETNVWKTIGSVLCYIINFSLMLGVCFLPPSWLTTEQESLVVLVMLLSLAISVFTNLTRVSFNVIAI